ncbi:hypothetical protein A2643_01705 [Candidatus Nomurabacteria bacterium RIFCSPHIGHO2_01_FULL_39_220]|uniref:Peptidase M10 metallopeptidase domain-containing protein n=1 Tax=Candidatus Nomurabacteria bacterium RIFCSPLOWO2_02_FULL_40_67 TaxID=1801787 RepID=A0A1F6Y7A9_9BACT|nr:MAG: Peptidase M10A and M12B matrixin and adamalysin [Parcubacteria group bacterium GW2011_GWA2_40_37]KKS71608.1 MAG: Peptidase M10A and M12B matrixin and adamalysin [Parcubacteria group bacterium GW2011_GWF2_42_7]OGI62166.1 MAG: hypothetical protein A2W12_01015 [Candidatus Nomurabacteria bacterium RBG_16_40_11]OGI70544.1 MAG: hypothetical protein A2643_01705 [Candidatus Nomurabacteria bacterium RIFCSPHIGHO2_01_FULL_39_220]OGI71990.1 MAG: hypothetical protein A2W56_03095 [Candidatus Nomuraba
MRKTFKILTLLLTLGVVWYLFQDIVINAVSARPCKNPISYSLVAFDERFGISRDYFINALKEAESIWEKPIEKDLFVYQENSKKGGILEVNLVYDYRQAATNKLKSLGIVVKENRASYDSLKAKFLETKSEFEPEKENFDKAAEDFNERRKAYEKEVKYWNARGGAPEFEYQKLESEKMKLEAESSKLRDEEAKIKEMMDRINSMVVVLNRLADTLNLSVEKYNTVGASRGESFEEGVYYTDGSKREIDIYEFQSKTKLVRVLAHELGHALDLSHVDDPKAIMYKLNQGGNEALAGTDLEALRDKCGIKSL